MGYSQLVHGVEFQEYTPMRVLLLLASLVQDTPADNELHKIVEKLGSAKTITCSIQQRIDTPATIVDEKTGRELSTFTEHVARSGTFALKGRKCSITFALTESGRNGKSILISDGKHLFLKESVVSYSQAPETLPRNAVAMLSWLGFSESWRSLTKVDDEQSLDLERRYGTYKPHLLTDRTSAVLEYSIVQKGNPKVVHANVRTVYDQKTYLIQERTISGPNGWKLRETFENWMLDADLPDRAFILPEEGKFGWF